MTSTGSITPHVTGYSSPSCDYNNNSFPRILGFEKCVRKVLWPLTFSCESEANTSDEDDYDDSSARIEQVRRSVLRRFRHDYLPDSFYDDDIEKIRTNDWSIERFFVESKDVERTTDAIIKSLLWRKSIRIREIKPNDFPQEFFKTGLFEFGTCKSTGQRMLYLRANKYRRIPELTEHLFQLGNCMFEQLDQELKGSRMSAFLDVSGLSIENADVAFLHHFLDLMFDYFPNCLEKVYVYEVSWFLKPVLYLLLKVLPDRFTKIVTVISHRNALLHISQDFLPITAGGTMETNVEVPPDSKSLEEFMRLHGLSESVVTKAKKVYNLT